MAHLERPGLSGAPKREPWQRWNAASRAARSVVRSRSTRARPTGSSAPTAASSRRCANDLTHRQRNGAAQDCPVAPAPALAPWRATPGCSGSSPGSSPMELARERHRCQFSTCLCRRPTTGNARGPADRSCHACGPTRSEFERLLAQDGSQPGAAAISIKSQCVATTIAPGNRLGEGR